MASEETRPDGVPTDEHVLSLIEKYKADFEGGPKPIHPTIRPVTEEQLLDTSYKQLAPEEDKEWLAYVKCGGAGDEADTPEQQRERYAVENPFSIEIHPGLYKHILRKPDQIITASYDYTVKSFDVHDNYRLAQVYEGHVGFVDIAFSYRGDKLLTSSEDCSLRLWQRGPEEYAELLLTVWINNYPMKTACVLPGYRCCTGGLDKIVRIISLVTGHNLYKFTDHQDFGPDDNYFQKEGCGAIWCALHLRNNILITGSDDATIRFWDIDKGERLGWRLAHYGWGYDIGPVGHGYKLSETFGAVWKMINLGDDVHFASTSFDRTIAIWDSTNIRDVKRVRSWIAAANSVLNMAVLGVDTIVSCGSDKEVSIWNWQTGDLIAKFETRGISHGALYIEPDVFALAGGDTTIRIINWREKKDLLGEFGFNAHEFIISECCGGFDEDIDARNWTKNPILYSDVQREDSLADSMNAIGVHKQCLEEALTFSELD